MANFIYKDNLESERLRTRMLSERDIPTWEAFLKDKEAVEFLGFSGNENPLKRSEQWIERQFTRYGNNLFGLQALIEKSTNTFIGQCGLLKQEVNGKPETEVGYHILKKYWGNGFAPEAARMFINYAFQNCLALSIISIIDKRNLKSQRVAEKNGLKQDGEAKWHGLDVFIYRVYSEEWIVK